jgi:heme exporter protein A
LPLCRRSAQIKLTEPCLIAENLACQRGERLIFTGISFQLEAGEALLLTGTNGSGKTSLLRLLATLIAPVGGRLVWGAAPVEADIGAYRERLRYIGHQDSVKPDLTPRETVAFWASLQGLRASRARALTEAALTTFALDGVADWPCRWLSAGQRKRLALARLVATPASIWLLDEPTSALDHDNQLRLERVIAEHRASGGRIVVASHIPIDITAAARLTLDAFAPAPADLPAG